MISISKTNQVKILLNYLGGNRNSYFEGHASIGIPSKAKFWVIAHNRFGWSQNDSASKDPEYWISRSVPKTESDIGTSRYPWKILVDFPCVAAAASKGICTLTNSSGPQEDKVPKK